MIQKSIIDFLLFSKKLTENKHCPYMITADILI